MIISKTKYCLSFHEEQFFVLANSANPDECLRGFRFTKVYTKVFQ